MKITDQNLKYISSLATTQEIETAHSNDFTMFKNIAPTGCAGTFGTLGSAGGCFGSFGSYGCG